MFQTTDLEKKARCNVQMRPAIELTRSSEKRLLTHKGILNVGTAMVKLNMWVLNLKWVSPTKQTTTTTRTTNKYVPTMWVRFWLYQLWRNNYHENIDYHESNVLPSLGSYPGIGGPWWIVNGFFSSRFVKHQFFWGQMLAGWSLSTFRIYKQT